MWLFCSLFFHIPLMKGINKTFTEHTNKDMLGCIHTHAHALIYEHTHIAHMIYTPLKQFCIKTRETSTQHTAWLAVDKMALQIMHAYTVLEAEKQTCIQKLTKAWKSKQMATLHAFFVPNQTHGPWQQSSLQPPSSNLVSEGVCVGNLPKARPIRVCMHWGNACGFPLRVLPAW